MYILVLTFIYISALISVKCDVIRRSYPKEKATQIKGELMKSLKHVGSFLAAVENKIKDERQILRNIAYRDFHPEKGDKRRDFMDYGATDINWWNKSPDYVPKQPYNKYDRYNPTTPYLIHQNDATDNMFEDVNPKMKEVLGQWIQEGKSRPNIYLQNTSPPKSSVPDSNKNNNDLNPILKEVVNKWVRNLPYTTPKNIATEIILTPIMTRQARELKQRPIFNYLQDDDATEDPFGIDFNYGGTTVGFDIFSTTKQSKNSTIGPEGGPTAVTISPFLKELHQQMVQRKVGYFTVFATKFLDIIRTMSDEAMESFLTAFRGFIFYMNSEHMLDSLGEPAISSLLTVSENIAQLPGEVVRNYASSLAFVMVNTETFFDDDLGKMMIAADDLFDKNEGEQLLVSLEHLSVFSSQYPKGNRSALVVSEEMVSAVLAPLTRLAGSKKRRVFITALNKLLTDKLPSEVRRMLAVKDNKNLTGLAGNSQLLRNTTESYSRKHPQPNFRRKMKHKKGRHHKKTRNHRKHHRNHRKMRKIRHNDIKNKKKQHLYTPAIDTRTHVMLRATYKNNINELLLHTTKTLIDQNKMTQKRYNVREDNPISLSLKKFRTIEKTIKDVFPELRANNGTTLLLNDSFPCTKKDDGLLRKIIEASSYSDEENDLKVKLYRAFDTM